MQERSDHIFDWPVQGASTKIEFVTLFSVGPMPAFGNCDMTISAGRGLDGDDRFLDFSSEIVVIQNPEHFF